MSLINRYRQKLLHILVLLVGMASANLYAQQRLEMEGTAIIGNKELPKVLYIVPWKSAERISLTTPPYRSVLDDALQPLDRPWKLPLESTAGPAAGVCHLVLEEQPL